MSDDAQEPIAPPPKIDPPGLVLRGSPVRVVRFRRGVIIAIAAFGSTAIVGVTWVALRPATVQIVAGANDTEDVASRSPGDALAGAPKSYGDLPRLGPPLPGDLGRPILRRQEAGGALPEPAERNAAADAAEAERQRLMAEQKSARESGILVSLANPARPSETVAPGAPPAEAMQQADEAKIPLGAAHDPGAQQRKIDSMTRTEANDDLSPHRLMPPSSPYTLAAGTIIAASLITGLNSDLPGFVTAQVTENVYDSATGRFLLLPQGSRLIGRYDSVVAPEQKRALVVWQRVVLPDASSIRIDNMPATDSAGYAGLADEVDVHGWQLLKGVALSTLLGAGTELSLGGSESELVRALRESAQQSGARAGDQIVARNLTIAPTVKVRPGWPLRVLVHQDIVLAPYRAGGR
jgi:type IV secretion system protein VirB10